MRDDKRCGMKMEDLFEPQDQIIVMNDAELTYGENPCRDKLGIGESSEEH